MSVTYESQVIDIVRDSITKGKVMSHDNLPPGCTDKDISDAAEATPATDEEVIAFVKRAIPKADDIEIIEYNGSYDVYVAFWLDRGDVER